MGRVAPVGLTVLLAACSSGVSREDLIGRYDAAVGRENQTVQLNGNGSYENSFYRDGKLVWRYEDRWTYGKEAALNGANAVTFEHFRFGLTEYDKGSAGFWPVQPERSWSGAVELCFDPDLNNRCFVREKA